MRFMFATLSLAFATITFMPAAESVAVGGSTTVKPFVERAVKALKASNPDLAFTVAGGGSGAAIKGLVDGKLQVGMLSREVKEAEKSAVADLVVTPVALDGLAIVVNPGAGVTAITKQQVVDIYLGKTTNWKDLGGADVPISLVTLSEVNGTNDFFLSAFKLKQQAATGGMVHAVDKTADFGTAVATVANTIQEAVLNVQKSPGSICYFSTGTAAMAAAKGMSIRTLELDGVAPTAANVLSNTYALRRTLIVVTKGQPAGASKTLIDWLVGPDGQKMATELDFIPLAK